MMQTPCQLVGFCRFLSKGTSYKDCGQPCEQHRVALRDGNGKDVVPQQVIELSRDYIAPASDSRGKASERELLARELRRDMSAAILRRIDAASRLR